ncbi:MULTISPECIES: hypothetical protein [unclassified Streptomyces]|uniref:hypothetical protein n=1 Tax=unclassified Streptomyces TaxID=2593676 RepID=UPI00225C09F9|nr:MULTISPECIES: hypothetical protein [unclassified Streptomyces]MCX4990880.1 hypothetical protein [Streptomyces sp. NBC_00568]MCX5003889.1 hypothetical protein [Streptomyces sp. NBC_00638]
MKANPRTTREALTRLLLACWGTAAGQCFPLAATKMVIDLLDDDLTWPALGGEIAGTVLVWAVGSLVVAAVAVLLLRRRARTSGLLLSERALGKRQRHLLRPMLPGAGWRERVREELTSSQRVFLVAEKGDEEIHFRWRPGRGDGSVWGSMTFDATAGTVLLDLREQEGLMGVAGLRRGSAFAAACQIARLTALESPVTAPA